METNDAAVKTNAAENIAAYLAAKGYTECSLRYHHTGAELFSAALCGRVLGYEPGQVQISHRRLVGRTRTAATRSPRRRSPSSPTARPPAGETVRVKVFIPLQKP